jgi:hypothetical protein
MTGDTYSCEICPHCAARNWLTIEAFDGDSSKMDMGGYGCWSCEKTIRLYSDADGENYEPHVDGTMPTDEFDHGNFETGREKP